MGKEPVNGHPGPVPEVHQDLPKLRPPAYRHYPVGGEEIDHPDLELNGCRTHHPPGRIDDDIPGHPRPCCCKEPGSSHELLHQVA